MISALHEYMYKPILQITLSSLVITIQRLFQAKAHSKISHSLQSLYCYILPLETICCDYTEPLCTLGSIFKV